MTLLFTAAALGWALGLAACVAAGYWRDSARYAARKHATERECWHITTKDLADRLVRRKHEVTDLEAASEKLTEENSQLETKLEEAEAEVIRLRRKSIADESTIAKQHSTIESMRMLLDGGTVAIDESEIRAELVKAAGDQILGD